LVKEEDLSIFERLQGVFQGRGKGVYPTIEPFEYLETLSLFSDGRPFIRLEQKTKKTDGQTPLHQEVGYIRVVGDSRLELLLIQPTGVAEIAEGTYFEEEDTALMEFRSYKVVTTPTAKSVSETLRTYKVRDLELVCEFHMAAVGHDRQLHLRSELTKAES
jgi:hypothetical protein